MFTGIITDIGRIRAIVPTGDISYEIETADDLSGLAIGASVACSGVCLTVVETGPDGFTVQVSAETKAMTTVDGWQPGRRLNLERALRVGDELGGHLVSGHIDGVGVINTCVDDGASRRFFIHAPTDLMRFIAPKGSVAADGVSLTVNDVTAAGFGVNVIAHTLAATTLGDSKPGDRINLEIDMLARYVGRLAEAMTQ